MKNFRKVKFTLEGIEELGLFDYIPEEASEKTTTREGLFHTWGTEIISVDGKCLEQSIGIVEEVSSGKVYHVIPKRITFLD